jgi:hypothetical protein
MFPSEGAHATAVSTFVRDRPVDVAARAGSRESALRKATTAHA